MEYKPIIEFLTEHKTELIIFGASSLMAWGYLLDKYNSYREKNGKPAKIINDIKKSLEKIITK